MSTIESVKKDLQKFADPVKAKFVSGYFKTRKGEYGAGDIFLGIKVPDQRKVAIKYALKTSLSELQKLISSKIHEHRFTALEMLVYKFTKGDTKQQNHIYTFYLKNRKYVNNWDLVDTSAPYIVGGHLLTRSKEILYKLARSKNIWERRIAIVTTQHFIRNNQYKETLKIAEILLHDTHDLIHKATGWMLREVGNRDMATEERFLKKHYTKMPRTMLRYAIEKFPPAKKNFYMKKNV